MKRTQHNKSIIPNTQRYLHWLRLASNAADLKRHIEPNSPSEGLKVAFIEVNGAPIELMQYIEKVR
ncbi:MAG: hypothetical protein AAGF93_22020 [Cyanobacteria bacterium P01_H01_bin.105]